MNFRALEDKLAPLYRERDAANRWEQAERLTRRALAFADDASNDAAELDRDRLIALCYLLGVCEPILRDMAVRTTIEACFTEQGWTPLMFRQLIQSLERLPDRPRAIDEKLVADAHSALCLGALGFGRHLAAGAAAGLPFEQCLAAMQKDLGRRFYTKPGQVASKKLRDELRELATQLRKALEEA